MRDGVRCLFQWRDDSGTDREACEWLPGRPSRDEAVDLWANTDDPDPVRVQGVVRWVTWTNDGVLVELR